MDVGNDLYQRVPSRAEESDSKTSLTEDYKTYVQYYNADRLPKIRCYCGRIRCLAALITVALVIFLIISSHKGPTKQKIEMHTRTPMKSLGGELKCDEEVIRPSFNVPTNVNRVRPADIKIVAAMGDSITAAALSKNFEEEQAWVVYPGNSFISGGDGTLQDQITVGKILLKLSYEIMGLSHGEGYTDAGFNVAVSGRTSEDLPRQASKLVSRMKQGGSVENAWKLVTIFIGTNDLHKLSCIGEKEPISREKYKAYLVKAISILSENLYRTIVSIIPMWNSQLTIEAHSLIFDGKRLQCGDHYMEKRDILCSEYRKVAYEIQDSRMFDREDFTVVAQGFMDGITDAFRNRSGVYDKSFYAADTFHLSKYGNAVLAKYLWNALLEPVGNKTADPDLGDDLIRLRCPTKERPYIQTLNNRHVVATSTST